MYPIHDIARSLPYHNFCPRTDQQRLAATPRRVDAEPRHPPLQPEEDVVGVLQLLGDGRELLLEADPREWTHDCAPADEAPSAPPWSPRRTACLTELSQVPLESSMSTGPPRWRV